MERLVVHHPDKAAFSHKNMRNSPKRLNHKRKVFDSQSPKNSYRKRFPALDNSHIGVLSCSAPHNSQLSQKLPLLPPLPNFPPSANPSQRSAVLSSAKLSTVMRNFSKSEQAHPKRRPDGNKDSESYPLITSARPFGPDPGDLPQKIFGFFSSAEFADKWSGSAFSISPSPSSLPLPSFSLNHKGRCSSEATAGSSGVDFSATESLRRMLRIH
ncbi:uncharacterized protein LOC116260432 [Nymphaea colorata]|uniref:uncharacterized protein LOC116260432 n=1 Tax=Nymphaea colorata TaxID=210225 RepID=UPI00129D4C54|nr:uncharacterized protein LOC116260432 [Nymphaea colorata]